MTSPPLHLLSSLVSFASRSFGNSGLKIGAARTSVIAHFSLIGLELSFEEYKPFNQALQVYNLYILIGMERPMDLFLFERRGGFILSWAYFRKFTVIKSTIRQPSNYDSIVLSSFFSSSQLWQPR